MKKIISVFMVAVCRINNNKRGHPLFGQPLHHTTPVVLNTLLR